MQHRLHRHRIHIWIAAADRQIKIAFLGQGTAPCAQRRRHPFNVVDFRADRIDVLFRNKRRFPCCIILTGINVDLTAGNAVEFIADRSFSAVADRHNHDNGRDADNNSQHRQNRPAFIRPDILDRHLYIFK